MFEITADHKISFIMLLIIVFSIVVIRGIGNQDKKYKDQDKDQ